MAVTLHRYLGASGTNPGGDLDVSDIGVIWGVMKAENLVDVFFHDGSVTSLPEFLRFAAAPGTWFYAARHGGAFIGFGVANNFSSSGNTAYVHLCSFAQGRLAFRGTDGGMARGTPGQRDEACAGPFANSGLQGPFAEAGRQWFGLLREAGALHTVIAVFPACYRGVRRWVSLFGFVERMRLPGAMRVVRRHGARVSDALVCELYLRDLE